MLLLAASCGQRQQQQSTNSIQQQDTTIDILKWPMMQADMFGCMMETHLGYRHEHFNCSLYNYVNKGTPSDNTDEYYDGPQIPENFVKQVHPWMKEILLNWGGGALKTVFFLFDKPYTEEQILTEFGIDVSNLPENIVEISIYGGTLTLIGFKQDSDEWDMDNTSNPAPPPPDIIVGTWMSPVKRGHVAYLEIFEDGMAGLYLGAADSDELYEIYKGTVLSVDNTSDEILMELDFNLDWYIYESEDGSPIAGVPNTYTGVYTLRHYIEDGKRMLNLNAKKDSNQLFGKKEMKMERVQKTLQNGSVMSDV
jgi:hypothetical protein